MIILTGGKTGGHIMPLLALAKHLQNVCYVGSKDSLEEKLCQKNHIRFVGMKLKSNQLSCILKCLFSLRLKGAKMIISTGGYVAFPALLYGMIHRIPIYLLEENVIIGKTNRFFSFFAKKVFLTFPLVPMKKKYRLVGLPSSIAERSYNYASYEACDVLILGGSLGSRPLCELAKTLKEQYKVSLVAGRYYDEYKNIKNVKIYEYVDELPSMMRRANVVISRAGASTCYEIFSLEKPCILIPSMNTSQNHQYLNALRFDQEGCAKLLKEDEAKERILPLVCYLLENHEQRIAMQCCQRKLVIKNSCEKMIEEIGIK